MLVWKLDRFARSRYDSAHYEYQLERNHVKLVSATEPISDSPAAVSYTHLETNIPDRKNYDIAELGLSVEAAKNLYTGRVNTEVVNLLLENARFAELTYRISQYFDDTCYLC